MSEPSSSPPGTASRLTTLSSPAPARACAAGAAPSPSYDRLPEVLRGRGHDIDALYVHVPFCTTKCHYCDFYSIAGHLDEADRYLAALRTEVSLQREFFGPVRPRTLFVGGGTPTLLSCAQLESLFRALRDHFDLSSLQELTIEANPNTFEPDKARLLAAMGVNRISFGAQSFVPGELRTLQRDHDPESVPAAFAAARAAGIDNLSLDLIFGIPGQTMASWEHSLARALELQPSHISCYSLTYEPNTAMTARLGRGEFAPLDEELELAMFDHVYDRLRAAGFQRYETSNYARVAPGGAMMCRHNLAYWQGGNWLALGPSAGAHLAPRSFDERPGEARAWQWKNAGSLAHYTQALLAGGHGLPVTQLEALDRRHWAAAVAVFWLRLAEGLPYRAFRDRTGVDPEPVLRRVLEKYRDLELVDCSPGPEGSARILDRGVPVSNRILADVLSAMESAR